MVGLLSLVTTAVKSCLRKLQGGRLRPSRYFPGRLWWILRFIHAPLWIAAPLSGLTFSLGTISTLSTHGLLITGVNETTFDMRAWTTVIDNAVVRWSQNLPTTPKAPNIFYAPEGSQRVSETFYNDRINAIQDGEWIPFFVAPEADSLLNGTAWGLRVNISCRLVNPVKDLQLLRVRGLGHFTNTTTGSVGYKESVDIYGASSAILAASNSSFAQGPFRGKANYIYPGGLNGTDGQPVIDSKLEIVVWQYYNTSFGEDPSMKKMRNRDVVVASPLPESPANPDILAFGLSFQIQSSVGYAEISAGKRTYSNFRWFGSSPFKTNATYGIDSDCAYCFIRIGNCDDSKRFKCQEQEQKYQMTIQARARQYIIALEELILAALTCKKVAISTVPLTCFDAWYMANAATGGRLYTYGDYSEELQAPALSPERMRLAVLKLTGELAAAMMGPGVEPFKGDLSGVQTIRALKPGIISWKLILALLCLWTLAIGISTTFFLLRGCDAPLLDGYQLFKAGAEWGEEVRGATQDRFQFCEVLQGVPKRESWENTFKERPFGFIGETLRRREHRRSH
ncbi:hypothetical protein FLONG3_64 [Fusarium longipes]|uniref:Uncharacterized protein n=1 Tax=Fusarium longipes TaxID=694270 RepID=A0A395TBC1_9HYPO|nr:hypothetical protein FLONG3_64 [Fusarium longipes]